VLLKKMIGRPASAYSISFFTVATLSSVALLTTIAW
jgi:hypothetical protein